MSQPQETYDQLVHFVHETAVLQSIEALLGWDERCLLPPAAADYRAEQMTLLTGMIHQRQTDRRLGEWLAELADSPLAKDPASESGATLRQLKRQYDKKTKLPQSLVEQLARTSVLGQQVWQTARHDNDFASFAPLLKKTIELKRAQAEAIGYRESLYDALLDDYEPDERTNHLTHVLGALRDELVPLVAEIRESRRPPNLEILHRHFPLPVRSRFRARWQVPSASTFRVGGSTSPLIRFVRRLDRTIAASPHAMKNAILVVRSSARCTKPATAFTTRGFRPTVLACPQARPCRWAFTSRSRGCGKIWSAGIARSGSIFTRWLKARLPH